MIELTRYELDFTIAFAYFQENLLETNVLCAKLLELVNLKSGKFFTILPKNIDLKEINKFRCGGIANGVRNYAKTMVLNKVLNENLTCIFDDVTTSYKHGYTETLFSRYGFHYNDEIYYSINKKSASIELINQCFYASNAIWHSLCLLSKFKLDNKIEKTLSLNEINSICSEVELIIVGAYDAEGYVFWERFASPELAPIIDPN